MNPLLTIFFYAAAGLAALLAFSWVLPLIAPFLIAFVSAAAMEQYEYRVFLLAFCIITIGKIYFIA